MELAHAVHHLVVLRDDVGEEVLLLVLVTGLHVGGKGVVGQAAGLSQFLEHDGVHAAAVVLVEQGLHGCLLRLPLALFVVDHAHVDVLGVIGCQQYLVLRGCLHGVVLAFRHSHKLLAGLVSLRHHLSELLLGERAII